MTMKKLNTEIEEYVDNLVNRYTEKRSMMLTTNAERAWEEGEKEYKKRSLALLNRVYSIIEDCEEYKAVKEMCPDLAISDMLYDGITYEMGMPISFPRHRIPSVREQYQICDKHALDVAMLQKEGRAVASMVSNSNSIDMGAIRDAIKAMLHQHGYSEEELSSGEVG